MIIHGDNLLALKALLPEYEGKVKCIYIDPPYNGDATGVPYDDNVEHSFWLSLMKPRLELLKMLLKDDGLIFVQIDDNEQAYLKILMDETFLRSNFVNSISVKMSEASGVKMNHAKI
jgi:adenine-specific DNA-methyltransferase